MIGFKCPRCGGRKTRVAPMCRRCRYPAPTLPTTFGLWTVLGAVYVNRRWRVRVRCQCGTTRHSQIRHLRDGRSRSCGCVAHVVHGQARMGRRTPEYECWVDLIQRCTNSKNPRFKYYGGRGIRVSAKWRASFPAFLADVGPRPSSSHSIDRIDVDGNYESGNCRWATRAEQRANQRPMLRIDVVEHTLRLITEHRSDRSISRLVGISVQIVKRLRQAMLPTRGQRGPLTRREVLA